MKLNPEKLFVVHYSTDIRYLTDDKKEAEKELVKHKSGEFKSFPWKITKLDDFGFECWSEGRTSSEQDRAEVE